MLHRQKMLDMQYSLSEGGEPAHVSCTCLMQFDDFVIHPVPCGPHSVSTGLAHASCNSIGLSLIWCRVAPVCQHWFCTCLMQFNDFVINPVPCGPNFVITGFAHVSSNAMTLSLIRCHVGHTLLTRILHMSHAIQSICHQSGAMRAPSC